eukprot:490213-Rhodomonas_salina.1
MKEKREAELVCAAADAELGEVEQLEQGRGGGSVLSISQRVCVWGHRVYGVQDIRPVSYTHLTLPTICSV